ncbi:MAG TPA: PEP-CTERM sorting domain-containing protein [Phycisphaerae bacterium]|nr:PEP-CTERM sorting domain-containing protein [Phycisphaerae bacterium]HXK85987.1 PEP-CTERM sorting domain-containing protein [Phycisphaerae bacterium]
MKKSILVSLAVALLCSGAVYGAYVTEPDGSVIIESRNTGKNFSAYSDFGFDDSSGDVRAPGCTATGSRYSSTTTYYGPRRQAIFSFTPDTTGLYDISLAWPSTAGQTDTAVVLYTGAMSGGDRDPWGNAGPSGVVQRTTMDMYYKNVGVWNLAFDDVELQAGTTYKVGIYGGHKSLNNPEDPTNRVTAGAVMFTPVPEPTTLVLLAAGGLLLRRRRTA